MFSRSGIAANRQITDYFANFFALSDPDRSSNSAEFRFWFIEALHLGATHADFNGRRRAWADDSYVHANGFAKLIVFVTECASFRLRVHVWPQCIGIDSLNVHNHRYSFASFIEQGSVQDVLWTCADAGESFRRFTYSSRNTAGNYRHEYQGIQALKIEKVRKFSRGHLYSLSPDQLHYTIPECTSATVTFFAEDRRNLRSTATTYSRHHAVDEIETFTPSLSYTEYQRTVDRYIRGPASA